MRRKAQEITDPILLEKILKKSEVVRIAMMDGNQPYILPLNYGYAKNHLYIHCAKEGKKIDLLKLNSKICFEVEEKSEIVKGVNACDWSSVFSSIIGYGEVEFITDNDEKIKALNIIMQQYGAPEHNQFQKNHVEAVLILKIKILEMTGKRSKGYPM